MKLFNAIAAAAVIGTSIIGTNPAEARNGWFYVATTNHGASMYSKSAGCSGHICTSVTQYSDEGGRQYFDKINCRNWTISYQNGNGRTSPIFPASNAEIIANRICR